MEDILPVIDLDLGAKILNTDIETAKKMVEELITLLPKNLEDLKNAYKTEDLKKIKDIAHFILGGSCYCGTPRLKAAAMALEKKAKASHSIEMVTPDYENLCLEIKKLISAAAEI